MKLRLLLALLATSASVLGFVALPKRWMTTPPPPPGIYTGLLTVRRTLLREGLETTFTVKAEANIAADGRITILTATPESPGAAANFENSVVRAVPNPTLITLTNPPPTTAVNTVSTMPINTIGYLDSSSYLVNGTTPANLSLGKGVVRLNYSVQQFQTLLVPVTTLPPATGPTPMPSPIYYTNSSPAASSGTVSTSPVSQATTNLYLPRIPGEPGVPVSQVSYEFVLRFKRPLPVRPQ